MFRIFGTAPTPPPLHLSAKKTGDSSASNGFIAFDGRMSERENKFDDHIAEVNVLISKMKLGKQERPMSPMVFGQARPKAQPFTFEVRQEEKKTEAKIDKIKTKDWKRGAAAVLEHIIANEAAEINDSHQELLRRYKLIIAKTEKASLAEFDDLSNTCKELLTKARKCTSEVIKFITECKTTEVAANLLPLLGLETVSDQIRDIFERTVYEHIQSVSNVVEDNLEKILYDVQRTKVLLESIIQKEEKPVDEIEMILPKKRPGIA